jgi:hypothetical protein
MVMVAVGMAVPPVPIFFLFVRTTLTEVAMLAMVLVLPLLVVDNFAIIKAMIIVMISCSVQAMLYVRDGLKLANSKLPC